MLCRNGLFLSLTLNSLFSLSVTQDPCVTVDGREGRCVPVNSCAWILTKSLTEKDTFHKSECGTLDDSTPLVCCRKWTNLESCGYGQSDDDGSLINREYVLTAAHCVKDMPFRLKPHKVRVKRGKKFKEYDVERFIVHPNYTTDFNNKINDLALLKLAQTVDFTDQVQPACLPVDDVSDQLPKSGQTVSIYAAGPSRTDSPRRDKKLISMQVRDPALCNRYYREVYLELAPAQLCVGGEIGRDACPGDSGGPLMLKRGTGKLDNQITSTSQVRWYQVGIVSLGPQHCGGKIPGIYVNLLNYIEWIEATVDTD
ncbi:vitamin K-dependent protein C [Culex quinquefasciatus]|uniref:CLIP domain-containing serine protease n=1 Tax=Culex quinquefasciatus TaxID=7176 RepID=B0X4L0_CULQU|nr:vitamin K-dependent protein C [Culex quinquefasciatus]|eukprot:XP_001864582.1 vitamin K-dependent protein C [Culex quinquefasciatus]